MVADYPNPDCCRIDYLDSGLIDSNGFEFQVADLFTLEIEIHIKEVVNSFI